MILNVLCQCGSIFTVRYKDRKRVKYCSKDCRMRYRDGVGNPVFNARIAVETAEQRGDALRGRGKGKTYTKEAGRHQHIVVMERVLGRPLLPGETVHHIDDDIKNNKPSNLDLLSSQAEHASLHSKQRKRDQQGRLK